VSADPSPAPARAAEPSPAPTSDSPRDRAPDAGRSRSRRGGTPHREFASWEPPAENDDDQPILPSSSSSALGATPQASETAPSLEGPRGPRRVRRARAASNDPPDTLPYPSVSGSASFEAPQSPIMPGITVSDEPAGADPRPRAARGDARDTKEIEDDPSFAQLFLNVGRRDGLRPGDVHDLLVELAQLDEGAHGRIRMRDRITFVSVRPEVLEHAITALGGKVVAGRTLVAERAKPRVERDEG
jgi:ATP-dependent RNA helicase DeaD